MHSEQEMLDLILETARADERVRAVVMNGSRANPDAPRDFFQDFDIIYFVTELGSFKQQPDWIDIFGERMILQLPDDMESPEPGEGTEWRYGYLIQLVDGNRIDLGLWDIAQLDKLPEDSQTIPLLDKDGILPEFPPHSNASYLPAAPTAKLFADCCNEFWWVCPYAAKGLWRDELPYAFNAIEIVREQLMKMLSWYMGIQTGFKASPGKWGKYLQHHLSPDEWELLLRTYPSGNADAGWEALFAAGELFRRVAGVVAAHFGYDYPRGDDQRVSAHLRHVQKLPKDATKIY